MSLKSFTLPAISIAELYKAHLYTNDIMSETSPSEHIAPPKTDDNGVYRILGSNGKNVTIIVHNPEEAFLPEMHLQFLIRILGACQLYLGDIAIVNNASAKVDMSAIKKQLLPKQLLIFGLEPVSLGLPLNFPLFKQQEHDGCDYLYIPPLKELNTETETGKLLKSKLWVSLRKLFKV